METRLLAVQGYYPTCPMELGARFEPLPDGGLAVCREGLLDVVHLDPLRGVPGPPEQPVDKYLNNQSGEKSLNHQ